MAPIPVVLLTGFLGSGKTTLLNHWLGERQDLALIINELGDIGIDQHLTQGADVPVTLMAGGCLCCVIQGSLSSTLRNLYMARQGGDVPAFSTVVIETTGAADPFNVLAVLEQDPWLKKRFVWQSVITVVDAVTGSEALARHPEVLEQVTAADQLVISKSDRISAQALADFQQRLQGLNAGAPQTVAEHGRAPASLLDRAFPRRCRVTGMFSPVAAPPALATSAVAAPSRHDLYSASLRWPGQLSWALWQAALAQLASECGETLVRVKGLLKVDALDGPLLVQWVGGETPALSPLTLWPDADTDSRLVLITRHPDPAYPQQMLAHWQTLLTLLAQTPP
ncbi:CobW family GTP-binding protein [Alcanivorax hongdengensis]|nr:GTP-binding protein [Alcanivorax hongdengensis]